MRKHVMKLRKVSTHSYAITLPKEVIKQFGWRERQRLELTVSPRSQVIKVKDYK